MQQEDEIRTKIAEAKKYKIVISGAEDLQQEIFKLRYQMLIEIHPPEYHSSLLTKERQLEMEAYDNHSVHCIIKLEDKIVGAIQIILGQKDKSTQSFIAQDFSQYFDRKFTYNYIPLENIAEISMPYILPAYRHSGTFFAILKGKMAFLSKHNITHFFLRIDPDLVLKYQEYGLYYTEVSDLYQDKGLTHIVCFNEIQALLDNLYNEQLHIWQFVTDYGKYYPHNNTNQTPPIKPLFLEGNDSSKLKKAGDIRLPMAEHDGRIQTLNGKGFMFPIQDQITKTFLDQILGKKVVEIGVAYGDTIIEGLKRGCAHYTAVDLEQKHLQLAASRVNEELKNKDILKQKVDFQAGTYPTGIHLQESSYDAILAIRVIHFLTPNEFEQALLNFYRILKPGGKVYILSGTPYVKLYQSFIPIYEQRKKEGWEYPGYVDSLYPYATSHTSQEITEKYISTGSFMFLDSDSLHQKFSQAGFIIEKCCELPLSYSSEVWQLDGRENVGLIAQKPEFS